MAKVINPLLSGSASGQLGHMMTFDKRGIVRKYVVPANPQTVGQMTVRNTLGDLQRTLKNLGATLRGELRTGFGSRWNSLIIGELTANGNAVLNGYKTTFTAFTTQQKTDWATVEGAGSVELAGGLALYAAASAIKSIAARLGVTVTLTAPAAGNSATVGDDWIG